MARLSLIVLIIALGVVAASDSAGQAGPPGTRTDEDDIKAVIAATTDAFSRHDAKAWVKFCTPDAQLVTVRGESMNGVSEIEKGLTTIFQTRGRNVTLKTLSVTVRFIRPDVALAHVTPGTEHPSACEGSRRLAHYSVSQHDSAAVITAHSFI